MPCPTPLDPAATAALEPYCIDVPVNDAQKENTTKFARYTLRLVMPCTADVNGRRIPVVTGVRGTLFKDGKIHPRKTIRITQVKKYKENNTAKISFQFAPIEPPPMDLATATMLENQGPAADDLAETLADDLAEHVARQLNVAA